MFNAFIQRLKENDKTHQLFIDSETIIKRLKSGQSNEEFESWILTALTHHRWEIRNNAIKIAGLGKYKNIASEICHRMLSPLEIGFVRRNAAITLAQINHYDEAIINALQQALYDRYWEVRTQAAITLSKLARPDSGLEQKILSMIFRKPIESIPAYPIFFPKRIFRERNFEVRAALILALGACLTDKKTLHGIELLLQDDLWKVRDAAIQAYLSASVRLGEELAVILSHLKDIDLTCPDFVPSFPIRTTYNRTIERYRNQLTGNNGRE